MYAMTLINEKYLRDKRRTSDAPNTIPLFLGSRQYTYSATEGEKK